MRIRVYIMFFLNFIPISTPGPAPNPLDNININLNLAERNHKKASDYSNNGNNDGYEYDYGYGYGRNKYQPIGKYNIYGTKTYKYGYPYYKNKYQHIGKYDRYGAKVHRYGYGKNKYRHIEKYKRYSTKGVTSCLTDNYYNYGNFFISGEDNHQPTILHCQKQCAAHFNCSLWTYGKEGGRYARQCYLKDSASGDERYDPALIEGQKNCIPNVNDGKQFNPNTGISSCLTDNYYNYGNIFLSGEENHQPTILHCQKQCATHLNCSLWTYGKKGGRYAQQCYLKHSASGDERYDPALIEGPKNCIPNMYDDKQFNPIMITNTGINSCLTENYYNYGNFFISGEDNHQPTIFHCQKQCATHLNCSLWTYGKKGGRYARQCYLKHSASGEERYDPGLIEGPKNCTPNMNYAMQVKPIVTTNTGECDGKLCGFSPCTTDSGRGGICNGRGGCVQTITNPCSKPDCKLCIR